MYTNVACMQGADAKDQDTPCVHSTQYSCMLFFCVLCMTSRYLKYDCANILQLNMQTVSELRAASTSIGYRTFQSVDLLQL